MSARGASSAGNGFAGGSVKLENGAEGLSKGGDGDEGRDDVEVWKFSGSSSSRESASMEMEVGVGEVVRQTR
jgi:hypothetical protein